MPFVPSWPRKINREGLLLAVTSLPLHQNVRHFQSQDVLNTYCWIHSTYTIPSAFWKRIGIDVAHPGIDKTIDPEERRYVRYYQWVCFCLFFQVRQWLEVKVKVVMKAHVSLTQFYLPFLTSSHARHSADIERAGRSFSLIWEAVKVEKHKMKGNFHSREGSQDYS